MMTKYDGYDEYDDNDNYDEYDDYDENVLYDHSDGQGINTW